MMYKTDQNCIPCFVVSIIKVGVKKIFHHIFCFCVWIFSRYVSWTPFPDSPQQKPSIALRYIV